MSKATASTIKTNNKEIFVERLRNEAADTSFLGGVIEDPRSNSEIMNILQNNDGDDFIACRVASLYAYSSHNLIAGAEVKENPNEAALVRLREWMRENPNYGVYGKDLVKKQVRFFRPVPSGALTKRYKVPSLHMHHLLFCLNDQGMGGRVEWNAGKKWKNTTDIVHMGLGVHVTMEWPSVNSEGFPAHTEIGYSTTGRQKVNPSGSTWSKLQGNDRTPSPFTMEVCGILDPPPLNGPEDLWKIERNHQFTLISGKSNRVHMMFPKEFSQFEHMNNAKGTLLRECRRFPSEAKITNIKVYVRAQNLILEFLGVTKSPAESKFWKAMVSENHDNIARYFYDLNDPATIRKLVRRQG